MFGRLFEDFFQYRQIYVLPISKSDATSSHVYFAEVLFVFLGNVLITVYGTDIDAHVILLIGQGDDRPLDHLLLVVPGRKLAIGEHVVGEVGL